MRIKNIAIIDHHRRAEEYIENPVFNHIDSAASSTCELMAEFIRFASINPRIEIPSTYATIMLSGIFLDSSYYKSKNTGIRTFEASTILKEYGATVKWTSELDAIITLNGKNYILDAGKCTLREENGSENLLVPYFAPGTESEKDAPLYTRYKDDFIVDNYTLQGALNELGFNYTVDVNYSTETITIR